jgi:copper resistance protein C
MRYVLLTVLLLTCVSSPAGAHAMLQHASPGAGAALRVAPKSVVLDLSEALEPAFSNVSVSDAAGQDVSAARVVVSGDTMSIALKPLVPGAYKVTWHAVSVDTHRTQGSYTFTVKP